MKFKIKLIFLIFICFSTPNYAQNVNNGIKHKNRSGRKTTFSRKEVKIINLIASLPEVKRLLKYNQAYENILISVNKKPSLHFKYYWIEVARNHSDIIEPIYNFFVTKDMSNILYYITITDKPITLEKWRAM